MKEVLSVAKQISQGVYKINANSNLFLLMLTEPILIDTGDRQYNAQVLEEIKSIIDPAEIKTILLTHLHYDHIGNLDLFPNAEIHLHEEELKSFNSNQFETILSENLIENFTKEIEFKLITSKLMEKLGLEMVYTPGHTVGSVCFYYPEKKMMFTGDTLFYGNHVGRTDLPSSVPEKLEESIQVILNYEIDILCPGHDY